MGTEGGGRSENAPLYLDGDPDSPFIDSAIAPSPFLCGIDNWACISAVDKMARWQQCINDGI